MLLAHSFLGGTSRYMALYSSMSSVPRGTGVHSLYSGSHVASQQALTMSLAGLVPKPLSFSTLDAV